MTDTLIKTLEAKAATANADLSSIGAVQATVAGAAAKIPMGTTRAADGSDAVGAAPSGVEPEVGGSGQLGWLGTIAFVLRSVKTAVLDLSAKLPSSLGQKSALQSLSVVLAAGTELPVTGPLTEQQLRSQAVTVQGAVTANLGSLNGAATDQTLAALQGPIDAIKSSVAMAPTAFDMQSMYRLQSEILDALRDLRIEQRASTLAILADQAGNPNIQDLIDAASDSID